MDEQRLTKSVGHLLHDAEEIDVLAADLRGGALLVEVFFVHLFLVRRGLEEGDVNIKVVRHLDAPDQPGVCEC